MSDHGGGAQIDPQRRAALGRAKLAALARDLLDAEVVPEDLGASAAAVTGGTALVLVDAPTAAALAAAALWAIRRDAGRLVVFADPPAGDLARLAEPFVLGDADIEVRTVDAATSRPASAAPLPVPGTEPDGAEGLLEELRLAGVEVVVEHGVVRGEIHGLEVARLVRWPAELGGDDELHLEAGVGRFDRDAIAAIRPDAPPGESLARTVAAVRAHRYPGAAAHPVQLLARERWLRSTVLADPGMVGASELRAAETPHEPGGLRDRHPAAAIGTGLGGEPVVVVCSVGVDLALVPVAADTRRLHAPDARLVLALPARDHHDATRSLAGTLRHPAELVAVEPEWG